MKQRKIFVDKKNERKLQLVADEIEQFPAMIEMFIFADEVEARNDMVAMTNKIVEILRS